jgi:hypothetical protein
LLTGPFHFYQAETFAQVISSDSESDDKAISAMGILNTLDTIVTVMENEKEVNGLVVAHNYIF